MTETIGMVTPVISGKTFLSTNLRRLLEPGQLQKIVDCGCPELIVTSLAFPNEVNPVPL
jgi:hypothetical protein